MLVATPALQGTQWFNSEPFEPSELENKISLVSFWSFGCEASLCQLRQLQQLRQRYHEDQVRIVAIHSPRFAYELLLENVAASLEENKISLPVLHDPDYKNWDSFNPEGWPSLFLSDQQNQILGCIEGSDLHSVYETIDHILGDTKLDPIVGSSPPLDETLGYPTHLSVTESGQLLITDSTKNQVLICSLRDDLKSADVTQVIAELDHPTAVASASDTLLYIAEAGSGSIRRCDFSAQTSEIVTQNLVAPTALIIDRDQSIVVADAGAEQILRFTPTTATAVESGVIAGSGLTGCVDGPADKAQLAQPVSLARTEVGIMFCDAASSNIRLLTDNGNVSTLVGNAQFNWGLEDGAPDKALLQRPTGIALAQDGSTIIIDTGNNQLRRLARRRVRSYTLDGLNRPTGVAVLPSGHIAVADTGNRRIIIVEASFSAAWPLEIS